MRMWNVDPRVMCNQHILGEHLEVHMFVNAIIAGKKLDGFIRNGKVEVRNLRTRHYQLVKQMEHLGMNHLSPLPVFTNPYVEDGEVDLKESLRTMAFRCFKCFVLQRLEAGVLVQLEKPERLWQEWKALQIDGEERYGKK